MVAGFESLKMGSTYSSTNSETDGIEPVQPGIQCVVLFPGNHDGNDNLLLDARGKLRPTVQKCPDYHRSCDFYRRLPLLPHFQLLDRGIHMDPRGHTLGDRRSFQRCVSLHGLAADGAPPSDRNYSSHEARPG